MVGGAAARLCLAAIIVATAAVPARPEPASQEFTVAVQIEMLGTVRVYGVAGTSKRLISTIRASNKAGALIGTLQAFTVGRNGELFVDDPKPMAPLLVFGPSNAYKSPIRRLNGPFSNPWSMRVTSSNELYFLNHGGIVGYGGKGDAFFTGLTDSISVVDATASGRRKPKKTMRSTPRRFLDDSNELAIGPSGQVYVMWIGKDTNIILRMDERNERGEYSMKEVAVGVFGGMAVDSSGVVYATMPKAHKIAAFGVEGQASTAEIAGDLTTLSSPKTIMLNRMGELCAFDDAPGRKRLVCFEANASGNVSPSRVVDLGPTAYAVALW